MRVSREVESVSRSGECLEKWRVPREVESASRSGECLEKWRVSREVESVSRPRLQTEITNSGLQHRVELAT